MYLKVIVFLALILIPAGVNAQMSISELNLAHQYNVSTGFDAKVYGVKDGQEILLFAAFKLPDTLQDLAIGFWGADNYKQPVVRIDSLLTAEHYLGKDDEYHYYEYRLNTSFPLVALEMVTGEETSDIYDVLFDDQKLDIALFQTRSRLPVLDRWINDNTYYHATTIDQNNIEFYVALFKHNFKAAAPPMSVKAVEEKELQIDSSFISFEGTESKFEEEGFYLFQVDTTSSQGFGWRLQDDAFPKINKLNQLIPPLKYITTKEEYDNLSQQMSKNDFDRFWLKLGGSEQRARNMISRFYDRVEHANKFFTTYKEGWKTDRGMIYIVYGPPHQVLRTEEGESWVYGTGSSAEVFQFLRFSHVFYPDNYVLLRDEKYRRSWFTAVDLLRNYYH